MVRACNPARETAYVHGCFALGTLVDARLTAHRPVADVVAILLDFAEGLQDRVLAVGADVDGTSVAVHLVSLSERSDAQTHVMLDLTSFAPVYTRTNTRK
jgi:hypothetical protein